MAIGTNKIYLATRDELTSKVDEHNADTSAHSDIRTTLSKKSDSGHKHSATDITSGVLVAERGGTGKTSLKDSANALMNALETGNSTPADNDYYISQYVNGGTTTTTYHRRPLSALWSYIKAKTDSLYLPFTGGKLTGQLKTSFKDAIAIGSYQASAGTVENLVKEVRFSSGVIGSVQISTYTSGSLTIAAGWYNFQYVPHRSGGMNGGENGDNCDYGTLLLFGMTVNNANWRIRVTSGAISEVARIVDSSYIKDASNLNETASKFAVLNDLGGIYYRTGAQILSDVGAYSKSEIDNYSYITTSDIDEICNASIVSASEVEF